MLIPLELLALHFVADFLLQTDWMGSNKSKEWNALSWHVIIYATVISVGMVAWLRIDTLNSAAHAWAYWWLVTAITHGITDAITSRITGWLWRRQLSAAPRAYGRFNVIDQPPVHWFFATIGFDQLIHFTTLALTLAYTVTTA